MSTSLTAVTYIFLFLAQNICHVACSKSEKQTDYWENLKHAAHEATQNEYLKLGAKTAAVAGVVAAGVPLALSAAGFGAAGVIGGSLAAGFQSAVLGGSATGLAGGVFAGLQSIGAAGLGLGAKAAIVSGSAAVVKAFDSLVGSNEEEEKK